MASTIGKRKRVSREELERSHSPGSSNSATEDLQAIFRRAFEAKFKPLPVETKKVKIEELSPKEEDEENEEESDWSGISDDPDDVEVIEYTDLRRERDDDTRIEMKAFMSSKPPLSMATAPVKPGTAHKVQANTDLTETTNLKHDLALQKLLRESHLLSAPSSRSSTATLTTSGIARHKSTDLHLQSLGAKSSVFTQKKMPMAQRKHMAQKARLTEEKRRSEAKEAGVVLERERRVGKVDKEKKRERGVGGPSIGRFKSGTLSLSKKDVRSMTGGSGRGKGKGGRGRR